MSKSTSELFSLQEVIDHLYNSDCSDVEYIGLYKGKMGLVWYNYFLYRYSNDVKYAWKSIHFLEQVFEEVNNSAAGIYKYPSLVSGLAGVGACLCILQKEGFPDMDLEEQLLVLDRYMEKFYLAMLREDNTDFFGGATGLLFYFSLRYMNDTARHTGLLDTAFNALEEKLVSDESGVWIFTNQGYLKKRGIDLSTAHGAVGMLFILLNLYDAGYRRKTIETIVTGVIRFIINISRTHKNVSGNESRYPNFIAATDTTDASEPEVHHSHRLAWCNGDLSILWLLVRAGKAFGNAIFLAEAEKIKQVVISRRDFSVTRIEFSYFCHGTSGVAQVYRKLYQATADNDYKNAYEYWIKQCQLQLENDFTKKTQPYASTLLFGWPGPVLTLMNYEKGEDLTWDQIFLLS